MILKNVSFSYNKTKIINNISFAIQKGTFLGIIGPNGSGKTTLVKLLDKILIPTGGEIFYKDKELKNIDRKEFAKTVAYLAQRNINNLYFNVFDFVLLGRYPHLDFFSFESLKDQKIVLSILEETNLIDYRGRNLSNLSGGELQRVLLAKALAQEPEILLLDEPTNHLDITHQIEILKLLKNLNKIKNLTIVFVSHDLNLISLYADEIILLDHGEIKSHGKPNSVLTEENIRKTYNIDVLIDKYPNYDMPRINPII
jgi:iron complex transport system ATP-binding protein